MEERAGDIGLGGRFIVPVGARINGQVAVRLRSLSSRQNRHQFQMAARAKFDYSPPRLPLGPAVGADARLSLGAAAAQASALNLLALGEGRAHPEWDIDSHDFLIAEAFHIHHLSERIIGGKQWLTPA
jgi:hypothetical protein